MVALAHPLLEPYDGLNRRIIRDETGGSGDKIHYYYNEQWQVLAESDGGTTPTAISNRLPIPNQLRSHPRKLGVTAPVNLGPPQ